MLKIKRMTSLVIAIMLLVSLFSGCKKDSEGPGDTTGKVSATKTATQQKTATSGKTTAKSSTKDSTGDTTPSEDDQNGDGDVNDDTPIDPGDVGVQDDVVIDLGGRTITFMTWTRVRENEAHAGFFKAADLIEQKYNCKFEIGDEGITWSISIPQWIQDYMAGIATYDLVHIYSRYAFPTLADTGAFHELTPYMDELPDELHQKVYGTDTYWRGKNYAITQNANTTMSLVYNSNILQNEGVPDINDYYVANDQWTWNEFLDVGLRTTKDKNGDGIIDQWGLGVTTQNLGLSLVMANGGEYIKFDGTEYVWNMNDHKVLNALQFMSDLYNTYKITQVWSGGKWGHNTDWINGKVAMSMGPGIIRAHIIPARPDATEFLSAYLPKSPNNLEADYPCRYILDPYFIVIPNYVKDPGAVLRVYADLIYTADVNVSDEEKEAALKAALDSQFISEKDKQWRRQQLIDIENGRFPIHYQPIGAFGNMDADIQNKIFAQIVKQQVGVAAAVEAITPQYVQLMKEYQQIN